MKKGKVDRPFVIALLILVGFGLLMVFSASMYSLPFLTARAGAGGTEWEHLGIYKAVYGADFPDLRHHRH